MTGSRPPQPRRRPLTILAWVGLGTFTFALLTLPVLAIVFLGHRGPDRTRTRTTDPGLASTDVGRPVTPSLGSDGIPKVLHATAPGGGQVVDQKTAHKIIEATWEFRLETIYAHHTRLLDKFETGVQLDADRYDCGCNPPPGTRIHTWAASATRQTTYPQSFLGQVTVTIAGANVVQEMAFERASADQPWKLRELSGYVIGPTSGTALDPPPAAQQLSTDPAALPVDASFAAAESAEMASFWNYWARHGEEDPQSYLSAGYGALTERGRGMAKHIEERRAKGIDVTYQYSDDSAPEPAVFPGTTKPDSAVVCGGTSYTATYTSTHPGASFHQPGANSQIMDPRLVSEGDYTRVEIQGYRPWCMLTSHDHRVWASIGFTGKHVLSAKL